MPTYQSQPESVEEQRLNALIGRWAMHSRLTEAQTEIIRQSVVTSSAVLSFEWWRSFFQSIGLVKRENEGSFMGGFFFNTSLANTFQHRAFSQSWASDVSVDFMPYLRLESNL